MKAPPRLAARHERILGIDPGLNITGFGVIAHRSDGTRFLDAGCIRPDNKAGLSVRLAQLHDGLSEIIAEHRPTLMVVEEIYSHYRHPRTAVLMAHARGVVCHAAAANGLQFRSYAATQVKKALTGNGRASKLQVQDMVARYLGLATPIEPVDMSDALAMALAHVFLQQGA